MPTIEYYKRRNGHQPALEWRGALDKRLRKVVDGKLLMLGQYGLQLLGTDMVKAISGEDADFFELRGGQCRMAMHYDRRRDAFVLLHGWLKQKQVQHDDIERGRRLLREMLSGKGL